MSGADRLVLDLIHREATLLDDWDLEAWLDLFTDDCIYWIPSEHGDTDPLREVSIVYDDSERLRARVTRLLSGKEYAQNPPSVTCHQLSNLVVGPESSNGYINVTGVQVVYEKRLHTGLQVLPARVRWRLGREGEELKILEKRIDLVDLYHYYENLTFVL